MSVPAAPCASSCTGPDGNDYPCVGEFREVKAPERLVFTNNAVDGDGKVLLEGLTTVTFTEQGGKTTMVLKTHAVGRAPIAKQMLAGMEMGWTQCHRQAGRSGR